MIKAFKQINQIVLRAYNGFYRSAIQGEANEAINGIHGLRHPSL